MRVAFKLTASALAWVVGTNASTLWSGSFNGYSTVADFDKWSWSNQVGAYQWYIHGSAATANYLALSPSYKNPALTTEIDGLKITIDGSSHWNGQSFCRTEIIPQTSANIGAGHLYYHFSIKRSDVNPPRPTYEHQVLFFESHFTEFKYGVGSNPSDLQWFVGGSSKWSTPFATETWYNFAYDIDFSAGNVGLWASTGSSPLVKVVNNVPASTSSNSADWHVGVLAFLTGSIVEDWYFSGIWVEGGSITAISPGVTGTTSVSTKPVTSKTTTTIKPTTTTTIVTVSATTTALDTTPRQYGQCGGLAYTGPTTCPSPYICTVLNIYYSQCL